LCIYDTQQSNEKALHRGLACLRLSLGPLGGISLPTTGKYKKTTRTTKRGNSMAISLTKAVNLAVRGIHADEDTHSVKLNGHNFYIRGQQPHTLIAAGETGYFRHQHLGKDDRVFYAVTKIDKDEGTYSAKITRIQFRGPLNSGTRKLGPRGMEVAGYLEAAGVPGAGIAKRVLGFLKDFNLQNRIDGNWTAEAAKIVDAIGARMAKA
jgi:hypothetical protein